MQHARLVPDLSTKPQRQAIDDIACMVVALSLAQHMGSCVLKGHHTAGPALCQAGPEHRHSCLNLDLKGSR